uniref:Uncharacterized protein n=1 Tax=Globisporangium ultimum (strain ATCC 200006 / CBS 805.95 / DAOM BR144) TaxID=431595 RepID=K3W8B7_GLOUD
MVQKATAYQQVLPAFPQFGRVSEDTESNVRWSDPVQYRPRSSSDRSEPKGNDGTQRKQLTPSFLGIPRKGVPLTSHAKEFASRIPVCEDVRVLRKQERAKVAEKYKQKLETLQKAPSIIKKAGADVVIPKISSKGEIEKKTDDAILRSMAELQAALSAMQTI